MPGSSRIDDPKLGDAPKPPAPLRDWPWHTWSRGQKFWVTGKWFLGWLLGLAAFLSALILFFGLGPQAFNTVFARHHEYTILRSLHAGNNLDHVVAELGTPAYVKQVATKPQLVQEIFMRKHAIVMTLTNTAKEVVLYSVTSCDQDFEPSFDSINATVTLQKVPLSRVESKPKNADRWGEDTDWSSLNTGKTLAYNPPSAGGDPVDILAEWSGGRSASSRWRQYFLGVNGACGNAAPLYNHGTDNIQDLSYFGPLEEAPDLIRRTREATAANFYTETYDLNVKMDDDGLLLVLDPHEKPVPNLNLTMVAHFTDFAMENLPDPSKSTRQFW